MGSPTTPKDRPMGSNLPVRTCLGGDRAGEDCAASHSLRSITPSPLVSSRSKLIGASAIVPGLGEGGSTGNGGRLGPAADLGRGRSFGGSITPRRSGKLGFGGEVWGGGGAGGDASVVSWSTCCPHGSATHGARGSKRMRGSNSADSVPHPMGCRRWTPPHARNDPASGARDTERHLKNKTRLPHQAAALRNRPRAEARRVTVDSEALRSDTLLSYRPASQSAKIPKGQKGLGSRQCILLREIGLVER